MHSNQEAILAFASLNCSELPKINIKFASVISCLPLEIARAAALDEEMTLAVLAASEVAPTWAQDLIRNTEGCEGVSDRMSCAV